MPVLLAVPILVRDALHARDGALSDAHAAHTLGADLIELRLDEAFHGFADPDADEALVQGLAHFLQHSPLPVIATCRSASEGGAYDGDDADRVSLYERLGTLPHPPQYFDIELDAYERSENLKQKINLVVQHRDQLRDVQARLILSNHDFRTRPSDLLRRIARAQNHPAAAVLKFAFRARSLRDAIEALDLPSQCDRPTIALAMGDAGIASRILTPKFGGLLTFAPLRPADATAPGQPTLRDLLHLYRIRTVTPATKVYGIVGWPVSHSKSPLLHNAGFEAIGHDGVYVPLPIPVPDNATTPTQADDAYVAFKATMLELVHHPRLDLSGCSVTIPHKEHLVRLAREQGWSLDATSDAVNAANTMVIDRAGPAVRVLNTDAAAARDALLDVLGSLAGRRIAVLGAGGAARAIAHALAHHGGATDAHIIIYARDPARAQRLADDIRPGAHAHVVAADWSLLPRACADAFINATPIGMSTGPDPAALPFDPAVMSACAASTIAMDTVYTPRRTPWLIAAQRAGWRTIDGTAMFLRQAAAQFQAWTGHAAPDGLFARLIDESA